jgi:hypothetical protein
LKLFIRWSSVPLLFLVVCVSDLTIFLIIFNGEGWKTSSIVGLLVHKGKVFHEQIQMAMAMEMAFEAGNSAGFSAGSSHAGSPQ